MKIYSHENQKLHHPKTNYSRGVVRQPNETPERLVELLKAPLALNMPVTQAQDHGIEPILAIHSLGYVDFLKNGYEEWMQAGEDFGEEIQTSIYVPHNNAGIGILAKAAKYQADGSAPIGKDSWTSIYWSAQTALSAAHTLLTEKQADNKVQVCITRPAGHHARKSAAGGFCYLNNAAIIAQHLRKKFAKVAILDTDMHHGQGIQEIFYDRSDVLYVSVHANPMNYYPVVAGYEGEQGQDLGLGYNINFPMPHGISETEFFSYVDRALDKVTLFNPDVIVHVLGFDVYKDDPLSRCNVTTEGFSVLANKLKNMDKPLITLVEGGYCIEKLNENMQSFLKGLTTV